MKALLLFLSLVISGCLFQGCDSHSDYYGPVSNYEPPQWTKPPKPVFSIEKRNEKYGLWSKNKLVFDFQYDSIRLGRWPVAINEKGKYVLITDDTFHSAGPFTQIDTTSISRGYLKVATDTSSGVVYTQSIIHPNGLIVLVPYPHSELISNRLFLVKTKNKDKTGIVYVDLMNKQCISEWLPVDKYFYMSWKIGEADEITIYYFKKNGDYCKYRMDKDSPVASIIAEGNISKEMGLTFATKFYNGSFVVRSVNGKYGLMNLDRQLLVPALYEKYKEHGDSIKFTSISEEMMISRSTGLRP